MEPGMPVSLTQGGDPGRAIMYNNNTTETMMCLVLTNTNDGQIHQLIQIPNNDEVVFVVNNAAEEETPPMFEEVIEEPEKEANTAEEHGKSELSQDVPENTDHNPLYYAKVFCRDCNKIFQTPAEYQEHNLSTHSDLFVCGVCMKGFQTTTILRQHVLIHSDKQFVCVHCNKKFRREHTLKKHITEFHGTGCRDRNQNHSKYICDTCFASFKKKANLDQHDCKDTKIYICPYCDLSFTRHTGLINHMLNQENKRNFVCSLCKISCNTTGQLRRHERKHDPASWFNCKECKKKYATASGFRLHNIRVHHGHAPNQVVRKKVNPKKLQRKHHAPRERSGRYNTQSCQTNTIKAPSRSNTPTSLISSCVTSPNEPSSSSHIHPCETSPVPSSQTSGVTRQLSGPGMDTEQELSGPGMDTEQELSDFDVRSLGEEGSVSLDAAKWLQCDEDVVIDIDNLTNFEFTQTKEL